MKKQILLSVDPIVEKYMGIAIESGAPFDYNGTKLIDLRFFYNFIESNMKADYIDFEECLKDLIASGEGPYELGPSATKSGNPETISYEVSYDYDEEKDEVSNYTIEF
ncbi:hypothetical protein K0H71_15265 [Bacillus sp. IITD106]|nr:hypothetical protein [Bacillus sp. IITD106]